MTGNVPECSLLFHLFTSHLGVFQLHHLVSYFFISLRYSSLRTAGRCLYQNIFRFQYLQILGNHPILILYDIYLISSHLFFSLCTLVCIIVFANCVSSDVFCFYFRKCYVFLLFLLYLVYIVKLSFFILFSREFYYAAPTYDAFFFPPLLTHSSLDGLYNMVRMKEKLPFRILVSIILKASLRGFPMNFSWPDLKVFFFLQ